jgi:hypothetical protein
MVTSATTPRTTRELVALVVPFGPIVKGEDLVFDAEIPTPLEAAMRVLHTGVRAVLTGKSWWGASATNPRVLLLCADMPIPANIDLLCVAGDQRWDRMSPGSVGFASPVRPGRFGGSFRSCLKRWPHWEQSCIQTELVFNGVRCLPPSMTVPGTVFVLSRSGRARQPG